MMDKGPTGRLSENHGRPSGNHDRFDRPSDNHAPIGPRHRWRTTLLADSLLKALPRSVHADSHADAHAEVHIDAHIDAHTDPHAHTHTEASWILDAGCGRGSLSLKLAERGHRILAFDLDLNRVRVTQARAREAFLSHAVLTFVANAEAIPLCDASIQGAAAGEVLEHVARDDLAFAELARLLAPGGALALTVPAGPERLDAFDRRVGHLRRYDQAGLRDRMRRAGFEIETQRAWGWPFGRVYDALVQRPALRAQGGRAGGLMRGMGRSKLLDWAWRGLFAVDGLLAPWAGERGSGWLVVGRKGGIEQ
jgi:SAM-dependent methyltransferase